MGCQVMKSNPRYGLCLAPLPLYVTSLGLRQVACIIVSDGSFCAATGYVIATDMDAQLLVTLPKTISGISRTQVDPEGALAVGMASQAR